MSTLLVINSSLFADDGQSSQLNQTFIDHWQQANPAGEVITRDLSADSFPHLTAAVFSAFIKAPEQRSEQEHAWVAFSDELINEIKLADSIVIGLPMYNFGVPSALKAYFDHIARAGVTFKYTETGPVGLLQDKPVYVLATRGGQYQGTENDVQTPYIKLFLQFIGLSNSQFVFAEGLNLGDESKQTSLAAAREQIAGLFQ